MKHEIVEVKNRKTIPVLAEMAARIKSWGYNQADLMAYFENRLGQPDFKVFVDTKLSGMMAVQEVELIAERCLFIELIWIDPHKPDLTYEFLKAVKDYAKTLGIKKISGFVKRGMVALQRKYGFSEEAVIISINV